MARTEAASTMLSKLAFTNASVMLICRVLADGLNVVLFVLISRLLGPEGVGSYAYGFALAGFIYVATSLGVEQYGVREYQRAALHERSRLISELLGLQLGVGIVSIGVLGLYLLATEASSSIYVIVYALSFHQLCCAIAATLFVPALAEQAMVRPSIVSLLSRGAAFAIASAILLMNLGSLAVAMLAFPMTALFLLLSAAKSALAHVGSMQVKFSPGTLLQAARALRSFAIVDVLGQLLSRAGIIVLTLMAGERWAGIYATGLKFVEVAFLPLWFVGVAIYPRLCRAHLEGSPSFAKLSGALLFAALVMTLLVVCVLLWGLPPLVVPVFGPGFAGAQPFLAAMSIVALVYGAEIALGRILYARDQQGQRAIAMAVAAVLCLLLNMLFVAGAGVQGAIIATAIAYLVVDLWYGIEVARGPYRSQAVANVQDVQRTRTEGVP